MATALSALTELESLNIEFASLASRLERINRLPPPLTRVIPGLPTLATLLFHGTSEYTDDFVARIDTPSIISLHTTFFTQLDFGLPRFVQCIGVYRSHADPRALQRSEAVLR
jgi:hypothetical protein